MLPTISPTVSHFEIKKPSRLREGPKAALKLRAWATESVPTRALCRELSWLVREETHTQRERETYFSHHYDLVGLRKLCKLIKAGHEALVVMAPTSSINKHNVKVRSGRV